MLSKIIAICGIDGAGKSTLVKGLYNYYSNIGMSVDIAKVEFDCKSIMRKARIGQFTNDITRGMARIAMAFDFARYYDALRTSADILICDRYDVCYRILNWVDNIEKSIIDYLDEIYNTVPNADLYIYCDIAAELAAKRLNKRGNRDKGETDAVLQQLLDLYKKEFSKKKNVAYISATQSENQMLSSAVKAIDKCLRCNND